MWNPFRKQRHKEQKAVLGINDTLAELLTFGATDSAQTPASAISIYEKSSAVSIPINKIADPFASIEPVLEFDGEIITEHPILELLNNPSPYFDKTLFFETMAKDYLVTGETELLAIGNTNLPPIEIQPISPKNVNVIEGAGGLIGKFIVSGNTLTGDYTPERKSRSVRYYQGGLRELKQIRNYSTRNNSLLRGQSQLVPASSEARQHILGGKHNVALLENGGRLSLVFHIESDLTTDEFERSRGEIINKYGGYDKAGAIGVTAGGKLAIHELGKSNKDMDYAMLQSIVRQSIALQYKVPLPLVTVEAATLDNYKTAVLALFDDAVLPLTDKLFNGLSTWLLPRFGLDPARYKITYSILQITALRMRVLEELEKRKKINIETDNELRPLIDREAYEGGDVIRVPANLIPVGQDLVTDDDPPIVARGVDDE